jgi:NAD+ kinase
MPIQKIALLRDSTPQAIETEASLKDLFIFVPIENADILVVLGGDGFMLRALHDNPKIPVYGLNCGSVGFLMNSHGPEDLLINIQGAHKVILHPLCMTAKDIEGQTHKAKAINEVSLFRTTVQSAKLKISVDSACRMDELVSDGLLLATPAGSTAYNLSVHGPIIPLGSDLLALTPISPFRPRRWRGALLPHTVRVDIEVLDFLKRPVSAAADFTEIQNVTNVSICEDRTITHTLLFNHEHNLEDRILGEQFLT